MGAGPRGDAVTAARKDPPRGDDYSKMVVAMQDRWTSADGMIDLRLGRWQDALADVEACDAVICDPPYSARTHKGHDATVHGGTTPREDSRWRRSDGSVDSVCVRRSIDYALWAEDDVREFVAAWSSRSRGWLLAMTSHDLVSAFTCALDDSGRYSFAPLPFYSPGSRVRLAGDGPSSWTVWIVVARPRTRDMQKWGTLPGGYMFPSERMDVVGGKPLGLMRAIVRDYTRPGDLVVDPFCGGGTTALACAMEGRRCITSEMDPATFEIARKRLSRGYTTDLFSASK